MSMCLLGVCLTGWLVGGSVGSFWVGLVFCFCLFLKSQIVESCILSGFANRASLIFSKNDCV